MGIPNGKRRWDNINYKTKRIIRTIIIISVVLSAPLFLLLIINTPYKQYFTTEQVNDLKDEMLYFSLTHKNPSSGLFIEVDIDSTYSAINSINFSSNQFILSKLIDPRSNTLLKEDEKYFFFHYLFEKQNDDGSFSDVYGLGNLFSTYEVVATIDEMGKSFLDPEIDEGKIDKIIQYLKNSQESHGYGFKLNPSLNDSDIISTYCGIKLAEQFSLPAIISKQNLSTYINSTFYLGGYSYTNTTISPTSESTYYGIKAFLELNQTYSLIDEGLIIAFFNLLRYSRLDGGYSMEIGGDSDVKSTYYSVSSLYKIGSTPLQRFQTLDYVLNCNNTDGGFGVRQGNKYPSTFKAGWAAMNTITLFEQNSQLDDVYKERINQVRLNYYSWLYDHQATNGLFGDITIESNYLGTLAVYEGNSTGLPNLININNTWKFVEDCYNLRDGGFGSHPGMNSSTFSTYCAMELYEIFFDYEKIELPNRTATQIYLIQLQNPDGGFKAGNDTEYLSQFFGSYYYIILDLVNTNISTVETTYWAYSALSILDAVNKINMTSLSNWIKSCQSADGGFPLFLGFQSDVTSTYYGLELLILIQEEPLSKISSIEFLKLAQLEDGGFNLIPDLSTFTGISISYFIITYFASKALYDYRYQPENMATLLTWFLNCISKKTGGLGDVPNFGGDLRNCPFGIIIINNFKYDHSFDPTPWNQLLLSVLAAEIVIIWIIGFLSFLSYFDITERLKSILNIRDKLNIEYLKRFPAINCENLSIYAGGKLIVDSVSLRLTHGEILGVLGESGAGKSTFVKGLLGMRKTTGISQIYGMDVRKYAKKIRPIYGYCPQDISKIYQNFTTLQNLLYFGNQYGIPEKEIRRRARRILRTLEIEDKMNELVKNLSGGQKRRVSIAVSLIHEPIIVWMDEPTSGLDPIVRENLWHSLTRINEQFNTTLIIITHYPEESRFCDKVAIFGRYRGLIDYGDPKDLLDQLPGKGRTIQLTFKQIQQNALEKLNNIEGIAKALEDKAGTDYSIFTDLTLNQVEEKIKPIFSEGVLKKITQSESRMEEYFRYRTIEIEE